MTSIVVNSKDYIEHFTMTAVCTKGSVRHNYGIYFSKLDCCIVSFAQADGTGSIPRNNNYFAYVPNKFKPAHSWPLGVAIVCSGTTYTNPVRVEGVRIDTNGGLTLGNWIYGNVQTCMLSCQGIYPLH